MDLFREILLSTEHEHYTLIIFEYVRNNSVLMLIHALRNTPYSVYFLHSRSSQVSPRHPPNTSPFPSQRRDVLICGDPR